MSHTRIDTYRPPIEVAASRQPQLAPPRTPFGDILSNGRQLLLAGASLTAGVIGGPVLAMAVNAAGSGIARGSTPVASRASAGATGGPAMEQVPKLAGCTRPMTSSPAVTEAESSAGITAVTSSGSRVGLQPAPGVAPAANAGAITTAEPSSTLGTSARDTDSDIAAMRAMNLENFHLNSQLMQLQEDIQKENRRFTTLSNVLRARHDTAKAAVGNIRS